MTRPLRWLLALGMLLAACTPEASGPLLPRPTPDVTTTILVSTTTTTADVAAAAVREQIEAGPGCPTDFCVIYQLRPSAAWSDGAPVTPGDFAHTVATLKGLSGDGVSSPYAAVASVDEIDDRTVRVAFDGPHGAWQTLFERVFRAGRPAASIADLDTTGPFVLGEWAEGEYLTLERDPDWWADEDPLSGARTGDIQRVRFVFIESLDDMLDALESGEVDVVTARPDAASAERLAGMEGVEHAMRSGPFWEHIDFNHEDAILSQLWARTAISLAIDREEILERAVRPIDPAAQALDNTIWMSSSPHYESHYDDGFDPVAAEQILLDEGCTRGEDGIYVCRGERMSFVWATTDDDPARAEIFESVREDLAAVGIEIVGDFRSPSDFVTRDFLFGGPDQWQLINFSWRARQDPITANPTYYCDDTGALNVNRFCSEDVERLIRGTSTITDPGERAAAYNRADRLYLEDRPLIPLYQKPTMMAWSSEITGPDPNHTISGDLWNVASWSGKEEVVVALPSEPAAIDPRSQGDDSANVILGAVLYGAFGMNPSHELIPALIERVELVDGTR